MITAEDKAREFRRQVFYAAVQGLCASIGGAEGYRASTFVDEESIVADALAIAKKAVNDAMELIK